MAWEEIDMFEQDKVKKARKEHVCYVESCKKIIKKGSSYYRRSFGQVWTWKACSQECARKMEKASVMWTY